LEELKEEKNAFVKIIEETEGQKKGWSKNLDTSEQKIKDLEAQLEAEIKRSQKLGELYKEREEEVAKLEKSNSRQEKIIKERKAKIEKPQIEKPQIVVSNGVELEEIVIVPNTEPQLSSYEKPSSLHSSSIGRILTPTHQINH